MQIIANAIKIKSGISKKIIIGNPYVKKEFNFAGDIINAVWILVNQNKIYESVLGSGSVYTIYDWTNYVFSKFQLDIDKYLEIDKSFNSDFEILQSDPRIIMSLGWKPKFNIYQLADLMIAKQ